MTEHSYDWWHRAMAGGKIGKDISLAIYEGNPQLGFFRMRRRERRAVGEGRAPYGPWQPVAIFERDGEVVALVGDEQRAATDVWLFCAMHPVSEEAYRHALETGEWPDIAPEAGSIVAPEAPIGATEPVETPSLEDRIAKAKAGVDNYAKIEDEATAKQAQTLRSSLLALSREADNLRKDEKQPHLDASREVDARWQPLVKDAKGAADKIARALSAFATAQAREHAAKRVNTPTPTQIKGGSGRAAPIRAVKVVTEITDQDALYAFLKTDPELQGFLLRLAQQAVTAGNDVPGVTVEEQRRVA